MSHENRLLIALIAAAPVAAQTPDGAERLAEFGLREFTLECGLQRQYFTNHHFVRVEEGQLHVTREWPETDATVVERDFLTYTGIDEGEWGGALQVKYGDGREDTLLEDNVDELILYDEQLFIVGGLSHLGLARGAVHVIREVDSPSPPELVTRLPDAPVLAYLDTTRPDYVRLVIVGGRSVMVLHPIEREPYAIYFDIMAWDAFWLGGMTPTSIVRAGGQYFIGLPHGVAVLPADTWRRGLTFYADGDFSDNADPCPRPEQ